MNVRLEPFLSSSQPFPNAGQGGTIYDQPDDLGDLTI